MIVVEEKSAKKTEEEQWVRLKAKTGKYYHPGIPGKKAFQGEGSNQLCQILQMSHGIWKENCALDLDTKIISGLEKAV